MGEEIKVMGFTTATLLELIWLSQSIEKANASDEILMIYNECFKERQTSFQYVGRVGNRLVKSGHMTATRYDRKYHYTTTYKGKERIQQLKDIHFNQLQEVYIVLKRIEEHVLYNRASYVNTPLPDIYRIFLSRLISVKDVIRHMVFSLGEKRTTFTIPEVMDALNMIFGWQPSRSHSLGVIHELEAEGAITSRWNDPDKRIYRILHVTDLGIAFAPRIRNSLVEQLKPTLYYMQAVIKFLE